MWSYGDPRSSVLDAVRFEVQDTNKEAQLLQDAEVEYAISAEAPSATPSQAEVLSAAARCMEALARRFSAQADTDLGSLRVVASKRAEGYTARARECRARAIGLKAVPWSGGQSESEKEQRRSEPDRVQPRFRRGQFETPYTGGFPGRGGSAGLPPTGGQEGGE